MVAVGSQQGPGASIGPARNTLDRVPKYADRKWSPRNGRGDIFFVWYDYIKDSLASIGISMADAYEPPPEVPESANAELVELCAQATDQHQDEGNQIWDVLHPILDLGRARVLHQSDGWLQKVRPEG